MRYLHLFVLFFVSPTICNSQLNLSVSYAAGQTRAPIHQNIITQFNEDRTWLQRDFKEMRWLNGFGFGLRYKIDKIAFSGTWENQVSRINATGNDPSTSDSFEQILFFKLSTYAFGIESFISDHWSVQATFEFNKARYRTEVTGIDDRFVLMNDWGNGSTFSVGYNFIGNRMMHVSVRPYMHLSWTNHDLSELDAALNPDGSSISEFQEEYLNFGLKVIFYNGPW